VPIQLKNRLFTYLILIIKNKQWKHWKRFETQTAQGFGIFDVEEIFQKVEGDFWEAQMFQDGYHRPEKGTERKKRWHHMKTESRKMQDIGQRGS